jgi:hypothetical protein
MKMRIILMLMALIVVSGEAIAQEVYYQTNMVYRVDSELSGNSGRTVEYWCDWNHNTGEITLYNPRIHRFVYKEYPTHPDGSTMGEEYFWGRKRMIQMTEETYNEIMRRVKQAMDTLSAAERAAIGDDRTMGIELYFDPKTDLPIGVVFTFHRGSPFKYVHPHFFRRLEIYLVDQGAITGLTVVPEAKTLNYTAIFWNQGII